MGYKVRPTSGFERDLKTLGKQFKGKEKDDFKKQIKNISYGLTQEPRPRGSDYETCPAKTERAGVELRKLRFKVNNRRGASGQGRLIYLISDEVKEVTLACLYTHAKYEKRPPDSTIRERIEE
ncbi:MAG: hypothetical protein ACFCBU_13725 [Cyanophyceae cyanobacterium]